MLQVLHRLADHRIADQAEAQLGCHHAALVVGQAAR